VVGIHRGAGARDQRWRLELESGESHWARWVVVCAGLSSPALLDPLGHARPQSPVLGQAAELQLHPDDREALSWPGSLSWDGINLVPRPAGRLWLGATLVPGRQPAGIADPEGASAGLAPALRGGGALAWPTGPPLRTAGPPPGASGAGLDPGQRALPQWRSARPSLGPLGGRADRSSRGPSPDLTFR
jgi:hypothetical protein